MIKKTKIIDSNQEIGVLRMEKICIIDGHNLLFRMFYGMPNKIYSKNGKCIHGVIDFIGSINKIIKEFQPSALIVVFDS